MGRLARAFSATAGTTTSRSWEAATKIGESHGERDAQRVFARFNLCLRVAISSLAVPGTVDAGPVSLPYLKVRDYFGLLLRRYPKLLFGGDIDGSRVCREFWQNFRLFQPEHEVFSRFEAKDWGCILPICIHGDKGRTYLKQPILCISFESVFGLPSSLRLLGSKTDRTRKQAHLRQEHGGKLSWSCGKRAQDQLEPEDVDDAQCPKRLCLDEEASLLHNGKGSTFMTRFLCTVVPAKVFRNHPQCIDAFLSCLQAELTSLFENGHEGYRLAVVGIKGDYEFHLECAGFSRSYQNVGTRFSHPFCPECAAGEPGVEGFDVADVPGWANTLHCTDPWESLPVLSAIPFASSKPATLYRRDAFHTLKYGMLKDFCASCMIYLGQLGYFDYEGDTRNLDDRLQRAYSQFKLYCLAAGKTCSLRKFSKGNFHRVKARQYPYLPGKGADSVICCQFIEFFARLRLHSGLKHESHRDVLMAMLETSQGALHFIGIFHSHNLFLPVSCARFQLRCGRRFLRGYSWLAAKSMQENRRLYAMKPKVHYFGHFLHDLQVQLSKGDAAILNYSALFNCESNEDWIGRCSRLSRRVSPKLAARRTIERYLLACKLLFKRSGL